MMMMNDASSHRRHAPTRRNARRCDHEGRRGLSRPCRHRRRWHLWSPAVVLGSQRYSRHVALCTVLGIVLIWSCFVLFCRRRGCVNPMTGLMKLTRWPLCTTANSPPNLMGYSRCANSSADSALQIPGSSDCRAAKRLTRRLERAYSAASRRATAATAFASSDAADAVAKADAAKAAWLNSKS